MARSLWCVVCVLVFLQCASADIRGRAVREAQEEYQAVNSPFVHDPSRITKEGSNYYVYSTGYNIPCLTSTDLRTWVACSAVPLPNGTPSWARTNIPENDGHDIWAPDVILHNGLYYLYYAINGGKVSAIGLLTSPSLTPSNHTYKWTDRGQVILSAATDPYSCIDPAPYFDASGNFWLSWGSGYVFTWSQEEIYEIKLNPSTGLRADTTLYGVVLGHVEASYVVYRTGYYYLFYNTGGCCSGVNSTYLIHVCRATVSTGPYSDKDGKVGSSSTFLASFTNVHGPGHMGILDTGGVEYYSYHYYNAAGNAVLGIGTLTWGSDGWPIAGPQLS